MKIHAIKVKNHFLGWELAETQFDGRLSLLVGVSGVGKTQILKSIDVLRQIVAGGGHPDHLVGLEWEIWFSSDSQQTYLWEGQFSNHGKAMSLSDYSFVSSKSTSEMADNRPTIVREMLHNLSTSTLLVRRDAHQLEFNGVIMPRLDSKQSAVHILKEEKEIADVVQAFRRITLRDQSVTSNYVYLKESIRDLKAKYPTIDKICAADLPVKIKLLLCKELALPEYGEIVRELQTIFPQCESISVESPPSLPGELTFPVILLKEKGVDQVILEEYISSGMLRALLQICEIKLSQDGAVMLIDEFENSLGVNCIDILTDEILLGSRDFQFIMTSHHPYIINNIPYEYWKIVKRKGGLIKVKNAADYALGRSKQAAFIQLTRILENED